MESLQRRFAAGSFTVGILACAVWGCSSTNEGTPSTGGSTSTGGAPVTSTGGTTGGIAATGGTIATGGTSPQPTGGTTATGGTVTGGSSTGGASTGGGSTGGNGIGGSTTSGGTSPGGTGTGGSKSGSTTGGAGGGSSGGSSATGGANPGGGAGGKGGMSSGGAATGGSGGASGGASGKTSPGCGSASPLKSGNFTESVGGTSRKWMLDVPANYDASKPYRLIFVWHPLGGSGSQVVSGGFNGLKSLSNSTAIFATADGLQGSNSETSGTGWWNANGGDMKLVQIMLDKINAGLCVDQDRIFSTGFSFGGMMSYTLPFEFNVFRAVAPCSGKTGVIPYTEKYSNAVPIMAFHGDADTFVATNLGKAFFDKFAARNKCGTQTMAVTPSGCVQYQDCTVPSTWCIFKGGHTTWSEEPAAIWKFFSQF